MGLINQLKKLNTNEQFMPGLFGFVFNPYFFNRRAIYTGIRAYASRLSGKMLDFGCGTKPYANLFEVDEHIGLDLKDNEGHELPPDFTDVFYDGKKIPFDQDTFDSVYSSEVFEHVFNLEDMLKEINRVHKSNGLLLITLPFVWREHEMPNDFGRYTSAGITSLLERNGYKVLEHRKNPHQFLSIVQLFSAYVHHSVLPGSSKLKFLLAPFIIFPIHLIGWIFSLILPKSKELYISHTILAQNVKKM